MPCVRLVTPLCGEASNCASLSGPAKLSWSGDCGYQWRSTNPMSEHGVPVQAESLASSASTCSFHSLGTLAPEAVVEMVVIPLTILAVPSSGQLEGGTSTAPILMLGSVWCNG